MVLPSFIAPPLMFLPGLGVGELAILFVIVLILFGPGKLPEVCRALGDGLKQFKNATKDTLHTDLANTPEDKPKLTAPLAAIPDKLASADESKTP